MRKYLKRKNNKRLKRRFKWDYILYSFIKDAAKNHMKRIRRAKKYGTYRGVSDKDTIVPLVPICSQLDGEVLWYESPNPNEN